jgi:hypothetical protein
MPTDARTRQPGGRSAPAPAGRPGSPPPRRPDGKAAPPPASAVHHGYIEFPGELAAFPRWLDAPGACQSTPAEGGQATHEGGRP